MGKIIPLIRINMMNVVVLIMTDSHLIVPPYRLNCYLLNITDIYKDPYFPTIVLHSTSKNNIEMQISRNGIMQFGVFES